MVDESKTRQPGDSDTSVVFRGDGEPRNPRLILERLMDYNEEVGLEFDSYSLGGTVEKLERRFAEMLGKESTIFMPTGTLANHLAVRKHCGFRPRAVVQEQSHLYNDTGDCATRLSGINLVPLAKGRPYFTLEELENAITQSNAGRVTNPVGAVVVESPVRRQVGRIVPFDVMKDITEFSKNEGIPTHLDGARLYMMAGATGIKARQYSALFDSVYVSLYKYFGAHFGAILAGTSEFVDGLYHARRMFGGGLPSAYMAVALALRGSDDFEERFSAAMEKAGRLFDSLNTLDGIHIDRYEHGSNIFPMKLGPGVDVEGFTSSLRRNLIFVYHNENNPHSIHLTVNTTILRQSNDDIYAAFDEALTKNRGGKL
jgi:threonine aldolase